MNRIRRLTLGSALKWTTIALAAGTLTWYAAFQARFFIAGPSITLAGDTATRRDSRSVTVMGTAENITAITLNDRPIFTDDAGNFREQLVLENGYTILTLRARDRYGRKTVLAQPFVYTPAYASSTREP